MKHSGQTHNHAPPTPPTPHTAECLVVHSRHPLLCCNTLAKQEHGLQQPRCHILIPKRCMTAGACGVERLARQHILPCVNSGRAPISGLLKQCGIDSIQAVSTHC